MYWFSEVLLVLLLWQTSILDEQLLLCMTVVLTEYEWLQEITYRKKKSGWCKQNQTGKLVFRYGWDTFYQDKDHSHREQKSQAKGQNG